jgi:hypothetical protein
MSEGFTQTRSPPLLPLRPLRSLTSIALDWSDVGSWYIAAPDVCDGRSAVGESRHRVPKAHPLLNRLKLA